jgi:hypothetical protein
VSKKLGGNFMKKVVILLVFVSLFVTTSCISVKADSSEYLSPWESAQVICSRLDEINNYAVQETGKGNINSCNFYDIEINEVGELFRGVYIDFNGLNGYVVVGENLTVYDFAVEGKSLNDDYKKSNLVYDVLGGYSYDGIERTSISNIPMGNGYDPSINGVDSDGYIVDIDDYVHDEYGTSYDVHASVNASTLTGQKQYPLSVYIDSDGYSEGNCGVVAAYNLLMHYRYERSYYGLPYGKTYRSYDPSTEETTLYNSKKNEGGYSIYDLEDNGTQRSFSYLYIETRQESLDVANKVEGLTSWQTRDILNNVMENSSYSTRFEVIEIWTMSTVTNRIDAGEALIWGTIGSAYGNHLMMVSGYDIYVKETRILFVTYRTYKDFFEIRDGHNAGARYYDFNGVNGGTVLGSFVVEK